MDQATSEPSMVSTNVNHYSELLALHPALGAGAVGWSEASQKVRFGVVADFLRMNGAGLARFSLLDVGCGLGALRGHLNGMPVQYRGVDLLADKYRDAILDSDPQADVSWLHQANLENMDPAQWASDFTVAVGTFGCKWPNRDAELPRLLQTMWDMSRLGMVVLMISSLAPAALRAKITVAVDDPCLWMRWAAERAPRFTIRHDYLPHDFALCMLRAPFED